MHPFGDWQGNWFGVKLTQIILSGLLKEHILSRVSCSRKGEGGGRRKGIFYEVLIQKEDCSHYFRFEQGGKCNCLKLLNLLCVEVRRRPGLFARH